MSEEERKRVYRRYFRERRNDKEYWAKRSIIKTERFIEDAEKVAMELETGYLESARIINQEIRRIFSAFENAFDLSQAEAKRLIDRAGNKTPSKAILQILSGITDPEKRLALEAKISAPAYKYRLDRLDKLNKQAKDLCKGLYGLEYATDSAFLATEMEKAYNYTIFDLQQGTGVSGAFDVLPKSRIEQTLKTNWSGKHFSSRIWGNTQTLADELRQSMIQSFITGESERKAAARIQERFNVGAYEARRLIRTENTYVTGQAELEAYKASGITKYEYASLIDDRTSLICERLDGKVYEVAKAKPGVNYPPMHPFCRSSTMAVLPSEEELDKEWDTFKADNVPQDMTFDEWLDKLEPTEDGKLVFISNGDKKDKFSYTVEGDFGAYKKQAEEIIDGVKTVLSDFGMESEFKRVHAEESSKAVAGMNAYGRLSIYKSSLSKQASSKGYFVNDSFFGTGTHEAGHLVSDTLLKKITPNFSLLERSIARKKNKLEKAVLKEAKKRYGSNPAISGYGSTNFGEKVAEAFSDVYSNKGKANPYSKLIVQIMKEINKGIFVPKI